METTFSLFLTKEREKQGISQERLCRGLCAVSALSRYENGERIPDRLLMNALIQRLGKSSDQLTTMISCQEYAYFVSAKYCYVTRKLRLHQNDRCKHFPLF